MENAVIRFRAKGQNLSLVSGYNRFAGNTIGYIRIEIEPDDEWRDFDAVDALFQNDQGKVSAVLFYDSGVYACNAPVEMTAASSVVFLNLSGKNVVNNVLVERLTTYPIFAFAIDRSANVTSYRETEVSPNMYEQYIAAVGNQVKKITDLTVSAHEADEPEVIKTAAPGLPINLDFGLVRGETGEQGIPGEPGVQGEPGVPGEKGDPFTYDDFTEEQLAALVGPQGPRGLTGSAAGFGTVSATVDNNEGEPSVTVATSGPSTAKNINFEFKNLKGEKGDPFTYDDFTPEQLASLKGVKGDTGETGLTPQLSIGTVTTLPPTGQSSVTIRGTAENPILDFELVKGDTGEVSQAELDEAVTDLKSAISDIQGEVGMYIPPSDTGTLPATSGLHTLVDPVKIVSGHSYSLQYSIEQASDVIAYFYVVSDDGQTTIASGNLNAGATSGTKNFTASISDENAYIAVNANARPLAYSVTLIDNSVSHDSRITTLENDANELNVFTGISDEISFTAKAYISTPSQGRVVDLTPVTLNGCACASVPCNKGDLFTLYGTPRDNSATRAYMWVNGDTDRCFYRSDDTAVLNGNVIVAPVTGTLVVNFSTSAPYSAYKGIRNLHNHIISNIRDIESIVNSPLETLPKYITNDMAYKPLGQLQNPYLCLSCDDGSAELETYTIPMLLDKDVPCTFGLWATHSEYGATPVFSPSVVLRTESGIDAVLSAVENGCEVAQHGTVEWTDMSEVELNSFFDREEEAFADMGITVKGAICPSHCVNNKVRAIAGGRFGSVRSGYNGFKSKADQQAHIAGDVFTPYGVLTGARSNCYSYTSFNTIDKTLNELKTILDNAISNNMCMIVYWHDWDLTSAQKETLEAFIDYAKTTTVQFCTLSEIPTLV